MIEHANWSDFFVAEVGAAAAFAGLLIVAISINIQRILEYPQLPGRAAEMLIMLVGAMLACSLALIPNMRPQVLGGELVFAGAAMTIGPGIIQVRALIATKNQPVSWWLWRMLTVPCASVPILIGAVYLLAGNTDGLYWIASGVLVTLAATVWNAWILLIEILR